MKLWFMEKFSWRRFTMSFFGTAFLGAVVALLRKAELGTDPWTAFVVGIADVFHSRYGVLYPVLIGILIVIVFIVDRHYIGIATVLNLFLVGTVADFVKSGLDSWFNADTLPLRITCLVLALVILCVASSLYITADLGVSSYDAVSLIMKDKLPVQFRWCRIFTDAMCTLVGFLCGARTDVGIGTIITALCMGPFTQFCCVHIAQPLLGEGN
ncbi:MAG: hypothetical protein WCR31_02250 [Treponema sp.]